MALRERFSIEQLKQTMKRELLSLSANRFSNFKIDMTKTQFYKKRNMSITPVKKTSLKKKPSLQKQIQGQKKPSSCQFLKTNNKREFINKPDNLKSGSNKRLKKKTTIDLQKSFGISSRKPSQPTSYPSISYIPEQGVNIIEKNLHMLQASEFHQKAIEKYNSMLSELEYIIEEL